MPDIGPLELAIVAVALLVPRVEAPAGCRSLAGSRDARSAQLDEIGTTGSGTVGRDEPVAALEDALRDFPADHVLIALRGSQARGWQEPGLLEQIVKRLGLPLTAFALREAQ